MKPGAGISRDISQGEATEKELDVFIERRYRERVRDEGHRPSEEMYEENARRYQERQRQAQDADRYAFHTGHAERLRRTLESLIARHESEAEKYLPKGDAA